MTLLPTVSSACLNLRRHSASFSLACAAAALFILLSTPAARAVSGTDAFDKTINLTPSSGTCVVIYVNTEMEDEIRDMSRALDKFRGQKGFRSVRVVDVRHGVPPNGRGAVRGMLRKEVTAEAAKLEPDYKKRGITTSPIDDLQTIPDFDGSVLDKLGWKDTVEKVRVVIYKNGQEVKRFDDASPNAVVSAVK